MGSKINSSKRKRRSFTRPTWTFSSRLSSTRSIVCPSRPLFSQVSPFSIIDARLFWNNLILRMTTRLSRENWKSLHEYSFLRANRRLEASLKSSGSLSEPKRNALSFSWVTAVSIWTRPGYTSWRTDRCPSPSNSSSKSSTWDSKFSSPCRSYTKWATVIGTWN